MGCISSKSLEKMVTLGLAVIWSGPLAMCLGGPQARITENAVKGTNKQEFKREASYHWTASPTSQ